MFVSICSAFLDSVVLRKCWEKFRFTLFHWYCKEKVFTSAYIWKESKPKTETEIEAIIEDKPEFKGGLNDETKDEAKDKAADGDDDEDDAED